MIEKISWWGVSVWRNVTVNYWHVSEVRAAWEPLQRKPRPLIREEGPHGCGCQGLTLGADQFQPLAFSLPKPVASHRVSIGGVGGCFLWGQEKEKKGYSFEFETTFKNLQTHTHTGLVCYLPSFYFKCSQSNNFVNEKFSISEAGLYIW